MKEFVKLTTENTIGTIEFFHPQSNSLPAHILAELAATITNAGEDDNIKVIILKSAGERAFCAGASFDELLEIKDAYSGEHFFSGFAYVINAARKCAKIIIGRFNKLKGFASPIFGNELATPTTTHLSSNNFLRSIFV